MVAASARGGSANQASETMFKNTANAHNDTESNRCKKQDDSTASSPTVIADGGTTWGLLSGFQRDILEEIQRLERDNEVCYGLAIKRRLEPQHGTVNHGRLYPNLDDLVDLELVEKNEFDKRTNEYTLTDDGRALLIQRVERLANACEMGLAATDGGDRA